MSITFLAQIALQLVVLAILIAITITDAKTMTIPDRFIIALAVCSIAAAFLAPHIDLPARLIGALCVSLPMLVLTLLWQDAFGGGDIKLMAAAGFMLGRQGILTAACIGAILGCIYAVYLLLSKQKTAKEHFAFGPSLCAGIAFVLLFGRDFGFILV